MLKLLQLTCSLYQTLYQAAASGHSLQALMVNDLPICRGYAAHE